MLKNRNEKIENKWNVHGNTIKPYVKYIKMHKEKHTLAHTVSEAAILEEKEKTLELLN